MRPWGPAFSLLLVAQLFAFVSLSRDSLNPANQLNSGGSERIGIALEALERLKGTDLEANPAVRKAVLAVLEQTRGTAQFVQLVNDFNIRGQDEALLVLAAEHPGSSEAADALRLVLKQSGVGALEKAVGKPGGARLLEPLGNSGQKEVVPLLQSIVESPSRELESRQAAVSALARIQDGATSLLGMVREHKLPDDLFETARTALRNAPWPDLKPKIEALFPPGEKTEDKSQLSGLISSKGNAANGAQVFVRDSVGCIKCHKVKGQGTDFGPDLSEIGGKLGKEGLLQAILEPSAGIAFGYEGWNVTLKDENELTGFVRSETPDELVLKLAGGLMRTLKKSDIESRVQLKTSLMPAGLEKTMSRQELADLLEYLTTLRK